MRKPEKKSIMREGKDDPGVRWFPFQHMLDEPVKGTKSSTHSNVYL